MRKLSENLDDLYGQIGSNSQQARIAQRAAQVRSMWAACVQDIILEHTNSVYIIRENDEEGERGAVVKKTLIVYVDESIFAAELNARRELIKLKLLQDFGEEIEEMKILISRGNYKRNYPFKESAVAPCAFVPLDEAELAYVDEVASQIESTRLREKFKKAMIADLERKKGEEKREEDGRQ